MKFCSQHDMHDVDPTCQDCKRARAYKPTAEEYAYLQKLTQQIRNLQRGQKKPTFSLPSNVYISRIRKENSHTTHHAEVIPPRQKHTPNAIDRVHHHISTLTVDHAVQMAVGHYLQYISQTIPPESFCTDGELSLLRKQVHTIRSPPVLLSTSDIPLPVVDNSTERELQK